MSFWVIKLLLNCEMSLDIFKINWFDDVSSVSPVYSCNVSQKYFVGVGFFDNLFRGGFRETWTNTIDVHHETVTKDNVVLWIKFRMWIVNGFKGNDPRGNSFSPYLSVFATFLCDNEFELDFFPGTTLFCYSKWNLCDDERSCDLMGELTITPGFKTNQDIIEDVTQQINKIHTVHKGCELLHVENKIIAVNIHVQNKIVAVSKEMFNNGEREDNGYNGFFETYSLEFVDSRHYPLGENDIYYKPTIPLSPLTLKFKIHYGDKSTYGLSIYGQSIYLSYDIKYIKRPSWDVHNIMKFKPPKIEDFPNYLPDDYVSTILTNFVNDFNYQTNGNGFFKMRKFVLCENIVAKIAWEIAPLSVCQIFHIPKKNQETITKKSWNELEKFCTSILRKKYGYTDFYDFDDAELKNIQNKINNLKEELKPFQEIINRCGDKGLETVTSQYEIIMDQAGPETLLTSLKAAEKAYDKRYSALVKNEKKREMTGKQNPNRFNHLLNK